MNKEELKQKHNAKLIKKGIPLLAVGLYETGIANVKQEYLCEHGHFFKADRARTMAGKTKCPSCPGKDKRRNHEGYLADLKAINSTLEPIEPYAGTDKKILHRCVRGHETKIIPQSVLRGTGCGVCAGNAKKTTEQYKKELTITAIDVIEEYRNATTKIMHKCIDCAHEWSARPHDIIHGSGCPACATMGFNRNKPAKLYYVRLENKDGVVMYKIGITNKSSVLERFRSTGLKVKVLIERNYSKGYEAEAVESMMLDEYKDLRVYAPHFLPQGGFTELFAEDVLLEDSKK